MTTTLHARVKRWAAETAPDRWTAVAWARDTDAETGLPISRHHRVADAPSHPEAMQAAHALLRELHEQLIGPVYESRATRRRTCPTCQHDAPALGHDTAAPRCMYHRAEPCPTCSGPIRETVGMVCQTCGTDYAQNTDTHTMEATA